MQDQLSANDSCPGVYVVGCGGHARVVRSLLRHLEIPIAGLLDDDPVVHGRNVHGATVLGKVSLLDVLPPRPVVFAIGDNATRAKICEMHDVESPVLIHPRAFVDPTVSVGGGTVVMAGAVIQAGASVGEQCIVNTNASVDHDCFVGAFSHVCPGGCLSGGVSVGRGVLFGACAVSVPGRSIGDWSTVGAGTVVIEDLPPKSRAVGNPARLLTPVDS